MLTFSVALFLSPGFKLRAKLFPLKLAIKGIFPDLPAPGCVRMTRIGIQAHIGQKDTTNVRGKKKWGAQLGFTWHARMTQESA